MSEKVELSPCPFCGGEAVIDKSNGQFYVEHNKNTHCPIFDTFCFDVEAHAIGQWNTRHLPPSVEEVLEAARRCERQETATRAEDDSTSLEEFTNNLAEGGFSWNNLIDTIRNHDKGRQ